MGRAIMPLPGLSLAVRVGLSPSPFPCSGVIGKKVGECVYMFLLLAISGHPPAWVFEAAKHRLVRLERGRLEHADVP